MRAVQMPCAVRAGAANSLSVFADLTKLARHAYDSFMIGERVREARLSQGRSLADVATRLKISVATLSRIENEKQSLDLRLFLSLARVLNVPAQELLDDGDDGGMGIDPLARRITSLATRERVKLWRELAAARRRRRAHRRGADSIEMALHVEELLAQFELLREELEAVRKRLGKR